MRLIAVLALGLGLLAPAQAQLGGPFPRQRDKDKDEVRLPNGKSQKQEILKSEHKKSQEEAAEMLALAQELKDELEKGTHQVVDLRLIKKAEDIEKLARNIKNRMKRY
jgi:hypothetical protein